MVFHLDIQEPTSHEIPPEVQLTEEVKINSSVVSNLMTKQDEKPKINTQSSRILNFTVSELPSLNHPLESVSLKMSITSIWKVVQVYVTHVESPYLVYGIVFDNLQKVDQLSASITESFSQIKLDDMNVKAGMLCSVKDSTESKWRRGVVTKVTEEDATVFCIDTGCLLTMLHTDIKPLESELKKFPAQVIPMKLMNVKPEGDKEEWTVEACDFFRGLVLEEVVKVLPKFKEGMISNVKMKMAVNDVQIDKLFESSGLAEIFKPVIPKLAELKGKKGFKGASDVKRCVDFEEVEKKIEIRTLPGTKTFKAIVTCAVSPRLFYIQLLDNEAISKVDSMAVELENIYKDQKDDDSTYGAGQLCALRYSDGLWYRGFIMRMTSGYDAEIWFIDYGIKNFINIKEHVRPLPEHMASFPAQALTLQLQFITPPNGEPNYTQQAMQRFKSLTEGRVMKVEHIKSKGHVHRVVMHDATTGTNVSQELIDFGFAQHLFSDRRENNERRRGEESTRFAGHPAGGGPSRRGMPPPLMRGMSARGIPPRMRGGSPRGMAHTRDPYQYKYFEPYEDHDFYMQRMQRRQNEYYCEDDYYYEDSQYENPRAQFMATQPPLNRRGKVTSRGNKNDHGHTCQEEKEPSKLQTNTVDQSPTKPVGRGRGMKEFATSNAPTKPVGRGRVMKEFATSNGKPCLDGATSGSSACSNEDDATDQNKKRVEHPQRRDHPFPRSYQHHPGGDYHDPYYRHDGYYENTYKPYYKERTYYEDHQSSYYDDHHRPYYEHQHRPYYEDHHRPYYEDRRTEFSNGTSHGNNFVTSPRGKGAARKFGASSTRGRGLNRGRGQCEE